MSEVERERGAEGKREGIKEAGGEKGSEKEQRETTRERRGKKNSFFVYTKLPKTVVW